MKKKQVKLGLKAPFPWFGGKSRAAHLIWPRFGNPANYVEPFAGSLAVLLARPDESKVETVNDLDCYLSNFWRAVKADPDAVVAYTDWPVNEADLHARHLWLVNQKEFRERMKTDPDYHDAKIAGWWVWGISQWIGSGWCSSGVGSRQRPHLDGVGIGVHQKGVAVAGWFLLLSERLRRVRVCCGDWTRVLGLSSTKRGVIKTVLLDPPYSHDVGRTTKLYAQESADVARDAAAWAFENGDNPLLRIALCGYEGEHEPPEGWICVAWKARGGYGNAARSGGRDNAKRERIWFSPYCLTTRIGLLGKPL